MTLSQQTLGKPAFSSRFTEKVTLEGQQLLGNVPCSISLSAQAMVLYGRYQAEPGRAACTDTGAGRMSRAAATTAPRRRQSARCRCKVGDAGWGALLVSLRPKPAPSRVHIFRSMRNKKVRKGLNRLASLFWWSS